MVRYWEFLKRYCLKWGKWPWSMPLCLLDKTFPWSFSQAWQVRWRHLIDNHRTHFVPRQVSVHGLSFLILQDALPARLLVKHNETSPLPQKLVEAQEKVRCWEAEKQTEAEFIASSPKVRLRGWDPTINWQRSGILCGSCSLCYVFFSFSFHESSNQEISGNIRAESLVRWGQTGSPRWTPVAPGGYGSR